MDSSFRNGGFSVKAVLVAGGEKFRRARLAYMEALSADNSLTAWLGAVVWKWFFIF